LTHVLRRHSPSPSSTDTSPSVLYTLSLHDALPISLRFKARGVRLTSDNTLEDVVIEVPDHEAAVLNDTTVADLGTLTLRNVTTRDRKSTRLNSSHVSISYAVFCLKKKKQHKPLQRQ